MVTQRKPKASKYLITPTRPVQWTATAQSPVCWEKMEGAGFGARQLAELIASGSICWDDNTTIMVGALALIPAGMRVCGYVIKNASLTCSAFRSMLFHDLTRLWVVITFRPTQHD